METGVARITITTYDNNTSDSVNFDVNVTPLDDAPTIDTAFNNISIDEDNGTTTYELNVSDVDGGDLNITVESNETGIVTVSQGWNSGYISQGSYDSTALEFNLTTVANASGIARITITTYDSTYLSDTTSFDVNVSAVDDAPVIPVISNQSKTEDDNNFTIDINATDVENDAISYVVTSLDTSKAIVSESGGTIFISPVANANGVVTIEVNATANGQTTSREFNITLTAVNDAPTIDTSFGNITIEEDNGTTNYELNVSDIDGDDLNITVESNETGILTVSKGWSGLLSQGYYDGVELDFNLTTVANANGMVRITITTYDESNATDIETFDVNVSAVDDAPVIPTISNQIKSEDANSFTIDINATDIENDAISYVVTSLDTSIATVSESNGIITVSPVVNATGTVTIEVNATANGLSTLEEFNITFGAVDDAPSIDTVFPDISIEEDSGTSSYDLNVSDIDGDDLNISIESNNTNILTVSKGWSGLLSNGSYNGTELEFNLTTAANANGMVRITITTDDNNLSDTQTFDVNVTSVDDAPTFPTISNQSKTEDDNSFTIAINATDEDNDAISYVVTSLDTSIATVSESNGIITVSPVANANGTVTIEVNATANGQTASQEFTLNIGAVNDAPTIDTTFNDITINEDSGVLSYELNISDIEGDELNITIESDNTNILAVSKGWAGVLSQGDYDGVALDFNLTTAANANGIVNISITVTDADGASSSKNFDVTVSPVNDALTLSTISDKVVYKNFGDINISIDAQDIDNDTLTYSAVTDSTLFNISVTDNIITISSIEGVSGNGDINVTVTDGDVNISEIFNFKILSFEDGDNIEESGDVNITTEGNTTILTITIPDDNLTLQTKEDINGSVSFEINIDGKVTQASSKLNGSKVEVTDTGLHTYYEDNVSDIKAEANATVTGESAHAMTSNGKVTKATSKIKGAQTVIRTDDNNSIEIETSVTNDNNTSFKALAKQDGSAIHEVDIPSGKSSKATSKIEGAQTVINDNNVTTTVTQNTRAATVVTNEDGTNSISLSDGNTTFNPLAAGSSFEAGSTITIEESNGEIRTTVESPLTQSLEF